LTKEQKEKSWLKKDVLQKGYDPEKSTEVRTTSIKPDKRVLTEGYNPNRIAKARGKKKEK